MDNKEISKVYAEVSRKVGLVDSEKFDVIVVDPPWNQGKTGKRGVRPNQGVNLDYSTLSFDEISKLPIKDWAKDNCFLFLWVTNSKDKKTKTPIMKMAFDLLDEWGFTFNTIITWDKKTGPCPFSPFQITTEHVIFSYRGKVTYNKASLGKIKTCFSQVSERHSVKPDIFYRLVEKYFPGERLDVFAREKRSGFKGWGDQYDIVENESPATENKALSNLSLF